MKNFSLKSLLKRVTFSLCAASPAVHALDFSIYGQAGLFGLGGGVGIGINEWVQARVGYGALSYNIDDVEVDDDDGNTLTFDAELDWGATTALVDIYPFKGTFHITAGLAASSNGIDLKGKPVSGYYTINNNTYTAAQIGSLRGEADWGGSAPYLGIGWGRSAAKDGHWSFNFDLGVLFTGKPDVSLSADCNASPTVCARLSADLEQEERDTRDELADADILPVVNFMMGYRF